MVKCNYLGKKIGFNSSIIDLLNTSSSVVNGIKNNLIDEQINDEEGKNNNKKKPMINKKNKLWDAMKHRKEGKITFCEDTEEDHIIQANSTDLLIPQEKSTLESGIIASPSKEIPVVKEKKKKKKKFI